MIPLHNFSYHQITAHHVARYSKSTSSHSSGVSSGWNCLNGCKFWWKCLSNVCHLILLNHKALCRKCEYPHVCWITKPPFDCRKIQIRSSFWVKSCNPDQKICQRLFPRLSRLWCWFIAIYHPCGGETVGPMFMLHFLSGMIQLPSSEQKVWKYHAGCECVVESVWKISWEYQCMYDVPSGYLT